MVQAGESEAPVRRQGFFPSQFYLISELLPSSFNSPSLFLTLLCHPRKQHSQPVAVLTSQICTHRDPVPLKPMESTWAPHSPQSFAVNPNTALVTMPPLSLCQPCH